MLELGILKTWNSTTYKAGVQLAGSLTTYLDDISVSVSIPSSAMVVGNYVLVAIPGGNPRDACVVASWPAGSSGGGGGGTKIQDADGDTKVDVEESADEDHVRMDVAGVEAFDLDNNGIRNLPKQSASSGYRSGDVTIPSGVYTKIMLNAESYDVQNEFDTTNGKYTASTAGRYLVVSKLRYTSSLVATKRYMNYIFKNGAQLATTGLCFAGGDAIYVQNVAIISLAASDYLELWTWQNSGAGARLRGLEGHTEMSVYKLG